MSGLYFNEERDYSEENRCDNVFSTIPVWAWTENSCGNESHEKETKHTHASAADLLLIRIGSLDWYNMDISKMKQEK